MHRTPTRLPLTSHAELLRHGHFRKDAFLTIAGSSTELLHINSRSHSDSALDVGHARSDSSDAIKSHTRYSAPLTVFNNVPTHSTLMGYCINVSWMNAILFSRAHIFERLLDAASDYKWWAGKEEIFATNCGSFAQSLLHFHFACAGCWWAYHILSHKQNLKYQVPHTKQMNGYRLQKPGSL